MTLRTVRLGEPRQAEEGLRLGAVRRPPRGVPRGEVASRNYYDVWLPVLSPSPDLVKQVHAAQADGSEKAWAACVRRFRAEMGRGEAPHVLDLLAALSHQTDLSLGCYCADGNHCHRSVLRALLEERGARVVGEADGG